MDVKGINCTVQTCNYTYFIPFSAQVTVPPRCIFEKLGGDISQLKQIKAILEVYSGTNLWNLGIIKLDCKPVHSRIGLSKVLFYIRK